ncbi:MAG: Methyltransferase type 11 [Microgenomates group bacterium GW2011_GWA1_48_10]|nr:MAG: Methyltransferase type 11 [Microgenomates group bacterium GW2011_GWA1_48_10]
MSESSSPQCPLCRASAHFYARSNDRFYPELPGTFNLFRCAFCEAIFIFPIPSREELAAHYPVGYGPHEESSAAYAPKRGLRAWMERGALARWLGYSTSSFVQALAYPYFLRIAYYPRFKENGRILDVGCGSGRFLLAMRHFGWRETVGTDTSPEAVGRAKKHSLDVRLGALEELDLPSHSFDAITLHHVFEHFADPEAKLAELRRILKPNGELIVTVPNTQSFSARIFGKNWFGLEIPRHLINYNRKNLSSLVEKAGFKIVSMRTPKLFATFLGSLGYATQNPPAFSPRTLLFVHRGITTLEIILDPAFSFLGLGDEIILRTRPR